jgi:hypothetical protein
MNAATARFFTKPLLRKLVSLISRFIPIPQT